MDDPAQIFRRSQDPRLTPVRPGLAASYLRERVNAEHFVDGKPHVVQIEVLDLKRQPRPDAPLETQLLYGETVVVFDDEDGWSWVQADRDCYVGYVATNALGPPAAPATHRVIVNRTFIYPVADMKRAILGALPLDGRVTVEDIVGSFAKIENHGFVVASHLARLDNTAPDFVTVAERLEGVPYLWGGKSAQGIDCSGLLQLAQSLAGRPLPRDTDMQECVGAAVPFSERLEGLKRGDLVFWRGHVGLMLDADTLLHANAHHMLVAREPLRRARERIHASGGAPISSIRRFA